MHEACNGGIKVFYKKITLLMPWIIDSPLIICALPIVLILRLVSPLKLIRVGFIVRSARIGHLTIDTEVYLLDKKLQNKNSIDLFFCNELICNYQLLKMWKRIIIIHHFVKYLYYANKMLPNSNAFDCSFKTFPEYVNGKGLLNKTKCNISFTNEEEKMGEKYLRSKGVGINDKFVCVHSRDSVFLKTFMGKNRDDNDPWSYHSYRNSDINDYLFAINNLTLRGYYIFRIGAITEKKITVDNPMIIDYACNGDRTDFLDIYLSAKSSFFIAGGGGPMSTAIIFRRPVVVVNRIPIENLKAGLGKKDITILKKIYSTDEKRILTFREVIEMGYGNFVKTEEYEKNNLEVFDNTPEEIRDVVLEMDARLNETWDESPEDVLLQKQFWNVITEAKEKTNIYRYSQAWT